mmetsp:Transcript_28173/g.77427  ORF Transcript_28173/g.77427 Transcript_28173/m.77427 type:complete len:240 (+) Transcript_28173:97-816(+)|eukprot:CAMPEP_0168738844 /NCGR_PEP_ID=MMETSP0724-20121128/11147_1 /TAXON_ID=265536 /ORGANISM="Amphiprora sp., Strain CCMP467" /LENGTH=239 /DNA_ID=CAMNT_0008786209 /DNA_START=81 /DNA_END=800 /DNA_ORIENTATION=+
MALLLATTNATRRALATVSPAARFHPRLFSTRSSTNNDSSNYPTEHQYSQDAVDACNQKSLNENGNYIIQTNHKGYGIYARQTLQRGDLAFTSTALETYDRPNSHSVQTNHDTHVTMDLPAILVNHSCEANLGITPNKSNPGGGGAYDFWALHEIPQGTEFSWDYETSEAEISTPFQCCCGSPKCRGVLQGFRVNGPQVLEQYGKDHVAPYLLEEEPQHDAKVNEEEEDDEEAAVKTAV